MKIWIISDTHCRHGLLIEPPNIDMVIHCGDSTNSKSPHVNNNEMLNFTEWFSSLKAKYKVFVPGNHDTSIEYGLIKKSHFEDKGIHILIDEMKYIGGIKIYGTPYTPKFGVGWSYNEDKDEMKNHLPNESVNLLVSHGPPLGILDLTLSAHSGGLVQCGSKDILDYCQKFKPDYCVFGHLHDEKNIINSSTKIVDEVTYINASVVDYFHELVNNGKIIKI